MISTLESWKLDRHRHLTEFLFHLSLRPTDKYKLQLVMNCIWLAGNGTQVELYSGELKNFLIPMHLGPGKSRVNLPCRWLSCSDPWPIDGTTQDLSWWIKELAAPPDHDAHLMWDAICIVICRHPSWGCKSVAEWLSLISLGILLPAILDLPNPSRRSWVYEEATRTGSLVLQTEDRGAG